MCLTKKVEAFIRKLLVSVIYAVTQALILFLKLMINLSLLRFNKRLDELDAVYINLSRNIKKTSMHLVLAFTPDINYFQEYIYTSSVMFGIYTIMLHSFFMWTVSQFCTDGVMIFYQNFLSSINIIGFKSLLSVKENITVPCFRSKIKRLLSLLYCTSQQ